MKKILFIFAMLGLFGCLSEKNQYQKGESAALDEIFNIKPDRVAFGIQKNRTDINAVILKFFKIGESKQEVILKLKEMALGVKEESGGKIIKTSKKTLGIFGGDYLATMLNIAFKFDNEDKLIDIKSMYYIQE